jgi:hypothetical protein
MKRAFVIMGLCLLTLAVTQEPALAAGAFSGVAAATSGPTLLISFTESGLEPGQNFAYTAAGTFRETFQCYRDRTFTPTHRTKIVTGDADPAPRAYTADANGTVEGFTLLWPTFPFPRFCPARQSEVPVHICYRPTDLVDLVEPFDVYWFPDGTRICGAIEPD